MCLPLFIQVHVCIMCDSKYPNDPAKQITYFMMILSALQFIGGLLLTFTINIQDNECTFWFFLLFVPVVVVLHVLYDLIRLGAYNDSCFTGVLWLYPFISFTGKDFKQC